MSQIYTEAARAEGKVRVGIARLAGEFAFHASVLERFVIEARPEVGTMGVTVRGDDVLVMFNPEFVLATPMDQLEGVLLHEVNHVVLGHVLTDPADYPDDWARVVAEEVTVNEHVSLPLPEGAITLDLFPGLPLLRSTRERYECLRKTRARVPVGSPRDDPGEYGPEEDSAGGGGAKRTEPGRASTRDPSGRRKHREGGASDLVRGGRTVDDHSVWWEARIEPGKSREAIREVIARAVLEVGAEGLPDGLKLAVEAMGTGTVPGQGEHTLQGSSNGNLDWRALLRRHVGQALELRPVFNRPPRRFPDLVGVLPGRRRQAARPRILAVLDTSGSITDDLLERIDAELARLARQYAVTVVECDAEVHRVYPYRRLGNVLGRGGTDLRPPLERAFLRKHRAELVVYFTDGMGEAPERSPGVPVIWCLTPGGTPPARWGRVIHMDAGDRAFSP